MPDTCPTCGAPLEPYLVALLKCTRCGMRCNAAGDLKLTPSEGGIRVTPLDVALWAEQHFGAMNETISQLAVVIKSLHERLRGVEAFLSDGPRIERPT
jgi:hypothetical protein